MRILSRPDDAGQSYVTNSSFAYNLLNIVTLLSGEQQG